MEKNPWKKHSKKVLFENNWIRLDQYEVTMPNGVPSQYTVTHFNNLAVGCVPIDEDNNVYLVGQWRFPFDKYSWEIPLGGASFDLDPLEECKRELKEETGLEAGTWKELLRSDLSNSVTDETSIIYICGNLTLGESSPEDSESLVIKKVPFQEALGMVLRNEITDALTVMAILKIAVLSDKLF